MIAAEVNVKAISTYIRPASVKITLDTYGHLLMPNREQETAAWLDEYLVRSQLPASERLYGADFSEDEKAHRQAEIPLDHGFRLNDAQAGEGA